ncbi:MAG: hypothetical protein ACYTGZ_13030 [Planctomycetota bacterium]
MVIRRAAFALVLLFAGSILGGCSSLLAMKGDPNMDVVLPGNKRERVEHEMGKADEVMPLADGNYVAVYEIKLGAPADKKGKGSSARAVGKGATATVASGAFGAAINSLASSGFSRSTQVNGAAALAVGLTVWGISELEGTIKQIHRLAKRRKHRLEVVYDQYNRVLSHTVIPLDSGGSGGDSQRARALANDLGSHENSRSVRR